MTYSQLYIGGGTDIQVMLQNIKPDTPRPRQCGRTYATLLLLAGQVFYGPQNSSYLYIGKNTHICQIVQDEFIKIVKHKGIPDAFGSTHGRVYVSCRGQIFIFATLENWHRSTGTSNIQMTFFDIFYTPGQAGEFKEIVNLSNDVHYG